MSNFLERYQKLRLRDFLIKSHTYPIACRELSSIVRLAYLNLPKYLQSLIFQDLLTAFRLLPLVQSQSSVSAAHLLVQSVEAALPKQKRNVAVKEFKHAIVAHKRCCKGPPPLPHDTLMHIFSFLDIKSLVSVGLVCRSWNLAANENHLWKLHYAMLFGSFVQEQPISLDGDRKHILQWDPVDTRPDIDWKAAVQRGYTRTLSKKLSSTRGYCAHCRTIVWLNYYSKCPNAHCGVMSNIQDVKPVTACQVAEYLLNDSLSMTSSSDSDSDTDSEGGSVSMLWAYPKHFQR